MTRGRVALAVLAALAPLAVVAVAIGARAPSSDWLAYGRTPDVVNAAISTLDVAAASRLRLAWERHLDGIVIASPLYLGDVRVGNHRGSVLFVVTGSNLVYALAAETGRVLWRRSLGPVVSTVCGGRAGIASTPAIDPARRTLYAMAASGELHAIDLATGETFPGWPLRIVTKTNVEYVWSGLRILGRRLYVPVASHCDLPDEAGLRSDGRLVSVDRISRRIERTLDIVPGPSNMGGIWGWGGVSIDTTDGTVYAATANSYVQANGDLVEDAGLAERVLWLSPSLRVLGSARQVYKSPDNLGDQGFGSTPMLFRPSGCPPLVAANSKNGYMYVWRRGRSLGAPFFRADIGPTGPNEPFLAQPAWVPATRTLVVAQAVLDSKRGGRGTVGYRVDSRCRFSRAWSTNTGGGAQPQPLVVGRLAFVVASAAGDLIALDTTDGRVVRSLETGTAYAPLIAVGGTLFSASANGVMRAYRAR